MVRDLVEEAVNLEREAAKRTVEAKADAIAEERILDLLLPAPSSTKVGFEEGHGFETGPAGEDKTRTRDTFRRMLREGKLDERQVEVEVASKPPLSLIQNFSNEGVQDMVVQLQDMMGMRGGAPKKRRKTTVREARQVIREEEADRLVDQDQIHRDALRRAEDSGIIFIDEIDKIVGAGPAKSGGPDVSREGVQRDLLPIVEGSTVTTKYGRVRTDHVLFIAAGAFHGAKVSDLIPELQGRFPIRVELQGLGEGDFVRILKEPKNSLIRQYTALLETEGIQIEFSDDAVQEMARVAAQANESMENIGARRLHTVMETVLEDLSFEAPERKDRRVTIDKSYVSQRLRKVIESEDLSRFVL
jgi:ATP-dependent HslUV protease ATP-binding subunit HslU